VSATVAMPARGVGPRVRFALADGFVVAWRNLIGIGRVPTVLVFELVQPIMFVLLFRFVYENAFLNIPGGDYVQFLMPGIFVQNAIFGSTATAIGLAEDLKKGLLDRFRSLPMARSAVLVGRTLADFVRNFFVVILMCVVGFIVGWSIGTNVWGLLGCIGIILAFSYSLSWVFAIVGLSVKDAETAQAVSFPILAPLVFASSAFVPVATMPSWLQGWAKNQPVSVVVNAARALTIGGPTSEYVIKALIWIVGIIAVCAPIAVARYRKAV
jgi:ABC-2 type transport system permease protein